MRFTRSPRVSTYLVALAIGDFACEEGSSDGIPIRVCAVPEKKELGVELKALQSESLDHWFAGR